MRQMIVLAGLALAWSVTAISPAAVDGGGPAPSLTPDAAPVENTKPLTAEECAPAFGASTPADAEAVKRAVDQWVIKASTHDRETAGRIALERMPSRAFPLVEASLSRQDLPADGKEWLKAFVERERPQERARMRIAARIKVYNEWNERTAIESYEKFGHKDPKWDETARAAIEAFVGPQSNMRKAYELLGKAVDQGCDDAFITYLYGRATETLGDRDVADQRLRAAAEAMAKTKYPPSRKELAALRAFEHYYTMWLGRFRAGQPLPPDFNKKMDALTKGFMDVWPDVTTEPNVPEHVLWEVASRIINIEVWPNMDRTKLFDAVYPRLEKALPNSPVPLIVKGDFYTKYAWDARGGGWANTVTQEGWKLFGQRLAEAHQALDQAWATDPTRCEIANEMITVALGESWPREKMEVWWERAMRCNPDDRQACENKMYFLEPKWNGTPEEMVAFGRQCVEQGSWPGDIPFMLQSAHQRLAVYAPNQDDYWRQPEVWKDLESIYAAYVKAEPKNDYVRSEYCYWACRTEHWDEAIKQFGILGDRVEPSIFGGADKVERYRKEAAKNGAI